MTATTATIFPSYNGSTNGSTASDDNANVLQERIHAVKRHFQPILAGNTGNSDVSQQLQPHSETPPTFFGEFKVLIQGLAYRPEWSDSLFNASHTVEIIATLRLFGLDAAANRLTYLHSLMDDLDPDDKPLNLESLRQFAIFLMGERIPKNPQIGMTPNGTLQAEWRIGTRGLLAMEFLASGKIRYAGISAPAAAGVNRDVANGSMSADKIASIIDVFREHLHA